MLDFVNEIKYDHRMIGSLYRRHLIAFTLYRIISESKVIYYNLRTKKTSVSNLKSSDIEFYTAYFEKL